MKKILLSIISGVAVLFSTAVFAEEEKPADVPEDEIIALISGLGAGKWKQREKAQSELLVLGEKHHDAVIQKALEAYVTDEDPELRIRIKEITRSLMKEHLFPGQSFVGITMVRDRGLVKVDKAVSMPILIASVLPGYPAEKAGIKTGDKILKIDDKVCNAKFQVSEIIAYISKQKPGSKLAFLVMSGNDRVTREVTTVKRPDHLLNRTTDEKTEFTKWFNENVEKTEKRLSEKEKKPAGGGMGMRDEG